MFQGPLLPLSPHVTLRELLGHGRPPGQIGAWIRGAVSRLHIHMVPAHSGSSVLASADLGFLLRRCLEVAVREGNRTVVLASETVIGWRALQVATATPYLPGLDRLEAIFPGLQSIPNGFLVPVEKQSVEEVLAQCLEEGMQVRGTRMVYQPRPFAVLRMTPPPSGSAGKPDRPAGLPAPRRATARHRSGPDR